MIRFIFLIIPALFIHNSNLNAQINTKALIDVGIHYGGDTIATIEFEDGDEQDMLAGQGLTLAVGGEFSIPSFKYVFLRTTLGLKYSTTAADNANVMFLRYPLNIMAFTGLTEDIRIGLGVTNHLGATLKGDGFFPDIDFDSSFGPRIEVGYKWVSLTYNNITFTDEFGFDYSGGAFGINFSTTLP